MKTGTHPAPRRPGFPPARERRLCKGLRRRASRVWRGTPLGRHPHPRRPPWGGIHTLPSTPWEAATAYRHARLEQPSFPRTVAGPRLGRHPQVHLLGATAYRHARGGGHPGVWRGTLSGGIHTLRQPPWRASIPPINLLAIHTCRPPLRGGRHSLPSCPRRRASRVWRGTPLGRHPHPPSTSLGSHPSTLAVNPFVEAATAYRHAREGGHPGSGGALLSGGVHTLRQPPWRSIDTPRQPPWRGIHILPSTPSWRPPQPTVMPAKAGIQWSGGALVSEAPSVKLSLRDALIHYRNFMNQSVRKVLTKHERRF